jgi:hypothetical protein
MLSTAETLAEQLIPAIEVDLSVMVRVTVIVPPKVVRVSSPTSSLA